MDNTFDLTVNALRNQGLNSDEILDELSKLFQKFSQTNAVAKAEPDEEKIKMLLNKLGVPIENLGYKYWVIAIRIFNKSDGNIKMKDVYWEVAKQCKTTCAGAERAMRTAVETVYNKCDQEVLDKIFGKNISSRTGQPKNKQFIAVVSKLI